jgi:hypothetical protein
LKACKQLCKALGNLKDLVELEFKTNFKSCTETMHNADLELNEAGNEKIATKHKRLRNWKELEVSCTVSILGMKIVLICNCYSTQAECRKKSFRGTTLKAKYCSSILYSSDKL